MAARSSLLTHRPRRRVDARGPAAVHPPPSPSPHVDSAGRRRLHTLHTHGTPPQVRAHTVAHSRAHAERPQQRRLRPTGHGRTAATESPRYAHGRRSSCRRRLVRGREGKRAGTDGHLRPSAELRDDRCASSTSSTNDTSNRYYLNMSSSSRYRDSGNPDCKIYVGDLGSSASKQDLEDAFSYYGSIRNVWVARNPPGFAFVEFEDPRDAEDAVRGLDGRSICGRRVRVELSNAGSRKGAYRGGPPRRGRPFHPEDKCYECGDRGHYARDCRRFKGGRRRSYTPSRSRSRSRSYSRGRRSRTRSRSRSRSDSRSLSRSRSRSVLSRRSFSRSRSRSR